MSFENVRIPKFEGFVTLTLTLDWVILHTVVHHFSTSTYMPNFIEIEENFCGRTDGRTYAPMDGRAFETGFIRSTLSKNQPNNNNDKRSKNFDKKAALYGLIFQRDNIMFNC